MQSTHDPHTYELREREGYRDTVRSRSWDVSPGQIVSLAAGVGFIVVGVIALARAELQAPLAEPVVEVLGFTHTAWLGLIEVTVGILLLLAGADPIARAGSAVMGALLVIAGVLIAAIPEELPPELGIEEAMGMPLVVIGAVIAFASLVLPVWQSRRVERDVDVVR